MLDTHEATPGDAEAAGRRFHVFRRSEAATLEETEAMSLDAVTPGFMQVVAKLRQDDVRGSQTLSLFRSHGMSLTYVWFRSGFPVFHHSHNVDCLYYITNGSLQLGTQRLGVGDGFFVGSDVPYAYTAGAEGVELIEFRKAESFDIKTSAKSDAYWESIMDKIASRRAFWADEQRPSEQISPQTRSIEGQR
jgi:hypothetical protein